MVILGNAQSVRRVTTGRGSLGHAAKIGDLTTAAIATSTFVASAKTNLRFVRLKSELVHIYIFR